MPGWLLMLVGLSAAIVICATLNYAVEKIAYRPLRNAPRLTPLITAIGMSILLQTLAMVVSLQRGLGARWWQRLGQDAAVVARFNRLLWGGATLGAALDAELASDLGDLGPGGTAGGGSTSERSGFSAVRSKHRHPTPAGQVAVEGPAQVVDVVPV